MTEAVTVLEKEILETVDETVLKEEGQLPCIKPLVPNAEIHVKFRFDRRETVLCSARNASGAAPEVHDLKDLVEDKGLKKDKCIQQHVRNAENHVRSLSGQPKENRYTAATVLKAATAEVVGVVAETGVADKWKASSRQ